MARDRSPPRRSDHRRGYRDDRRDYHRGDYKDQRDRRNYRDDRDSSRRDPRRLTPPRDRDPNEGRLSRPDDDRNQHGRRDRSRDRKRERSPDRDRNGRHRSRSRERLRDDRSYRDDSRERKRPRRSDSVESHHRRQRDSSRDRGHGVNSDVRDVRDSTKLVRECKLTSIQRHARSFEDEEKRKQDEDAKKKAERQARLVEWKKKKEAELAGKSSPRTATTVVDDQSAAESPTGAASPNTPRNVTASSPIATSVAAKPFAGKFDPKAIAKRATMAKSRLEASALGAENTVRPKLANATVPGASTSMNINKTGSNGAIGSALRSTKGASSAISKGFGINQSGDADDDTTKEPTLDMDDEEANRTRLDKAALANFDPLDGGDDDAPMAEGDDQEDDYDAMDDGDEEEQAAAARAAAERRAQAAAAQEKSTLAAAVEENTAMDNYDDDEEVDPLDAFMENLEEDPKRKSANRKNKLLEAEVAFSDDEETILEAVGDGDTVVVPKKKKKEIPTVDHKKVEYEEFRKNFYSEPLELQEMSEEDVKSLRFELDDIKVQGSNVPKPVQRFAQFGLGTQVLDIIRGLGFDKPTCIQAQAIPAIMSGRDVIGVARTGSGKTVAFLLPMFRHIKDQRPLEALDGPIGLVMAPTRELATQIHRECRPYLKALNLRAVCAYGGAPITEQIAALKKGAEIVVCTPGRLIDLLSANSGRVINLRRVTYVVMDEADRMFDMGFEPQIAKVLANIRPDKQCVLFSATFPRKMEGLARKELSKPVQITVGGRSTVPKEITQKVEILAEDDKLKRLLQLVGEETSIDDDRRVLVFVERQETADMLLGKLQRSGYPCVSVHGGREQVDRDAALDDFKAGNVPLMIATSVAARGLDVKQLTLVVNYDVPSHLEDYVHRAGRTGRAGNTGTAVTFLTPEQERHAIDIARAFTQSEQAVPAELQALADSFEAKIKEGSATRYGSGFGGHGLDRLEQVHSAELARQRRAYKTEDQPEEDDEEKSKAKAKEPEEIKVFAKGETQPAAAPAPVAAARPSGIPSHYDLEGDIKVEKYEKPPPTAATGSRLDRAAAAAAAINSRLGAGGAARAGASIDNRGPDAGEYHYKLEINDFPQKARWAVTNRTNVAKILESTGVSITTKGRFYKAGEEPEVGGLPKMNVLIEGDTELQVVTAVRELRRLLNEAVVAEADAAGRAPVGGRYSVV